jgi:hypothetical protein
MDLLERSLKRIASIVWLEHTVLRWERLLLALAKTVVLVNFRLASVQDKKAIALIAQSVGMAEVLD